MRINFEKDLNPEQLAAVTHTDGPALILAGAGSGKTRVIVYRVAYLLENGARPQDILLLTFTNKAAQEMLQRVELLVGRSAQDLWGGTFHHVAARILRMHGNLLGYSPNFSILDSEDARSMLKAIMTEGGIDTKMRRPPSPAVIQDIISFSRNSRKSLPEVLEIKYKGFLKLEQEIADIASRYRDRKIATNTMDFDDLLCNFVLLLQRNLALTKVFQNTWKHILVDEYQDTNLIQGNLIELLYAEQSNRSLTVVGDDAQSIYSFRGATIENILAFRNIYPQAKIFRLQMNYRSTTPILYLANDIIRHNTAQFEKYLRGITPGEEKPQLIIAATAQEEAMYIAEKILELQESGISPQHIAVVFRAAYQSEMLEFELAKRDIPYEYRGGVRFFERAHVKDVLAMARIVANPSDEAAWLRVLCFMPGIGLVSAGKIIGRIRGVSGHEGILAQNFSDLGNRIQTGWSDFLSLFRTFIGLAQVLPKVVIEVLLRSAYTHYLETEYPDWKDRVEDIEQLKIFAASYNSLFDFLGDIALFENFSAHDNQKRDDRIVLSTIHQAKGLEWDTVFIMNMANSAFPNRRAVTEEGGLEEERRLFYVAVTRAKKFLFLSYPLLGGIDGVSMNQPSLFLDEIERTLIKVIPIRREDSSDDLPTIDLEKRELLRPTKPLRI